MSDLEENQQACRLRFPELSRIEFSESESTEVTTVNEEQNNRPTCVCPEASRLSNILVTFFQPVRRTSNIVYHGISIVLNLFFEGWLYLTYPIRQYLHQKHRKWGRNLENKANKTYNSLQTMVRQYITVPLIAWLIKYLFLRQNNKVYTSQKLEQGMEPNDYRIVSKGILISCYKTLMLVYNIRVYRCQFIQTLHHWHQCTTAWIIDFMEVSSVLVALVETITQIAAVYADVVLILSDCLRFTCHALVYLRNVFWLADTGLYLLNQMTLRLRVEM